MKTHYFLTAMMIIVLGIPLLSQDGSSSNSAYLTIDATGGTETISRHIYGHFSEHLGHCIYGGYWVGYDSEIPNTKGIRNDVVAALRNIAIPNLRWPGGCFADEYHWMDGIGDPAHRPKMINTHWGGVTEDNSFGTHEFMELCEQLGTEPVICGNVGSGTVQEMSSWVEYLNFEGISPMADHRRANGRESAWGVKYWDVGNENWGCGGNMTADFYADQYRRYATYCRNYGKNKLFKIAGGANSEDFGWTETLMQKIPHHMMNGISLHYYTSNWSNKGPATGFGEDHYFDVLRRCLHIEKTIDRHMEIMDKYDPEKRVALAFDEWGTWYDVEPGTNPGFLYQQNSMRDALVAALTLNYLNAKCERVRMANIAQTVNVLQALIFTEGDQMVLTPTYHIYDMYQVHHDATLLPLILEGPDYVLGSEALPAISASASMDKEGLIHLSLVNIDPDQAVNIQVELKGKDSGDVKGQVLSSEMLDSHNSFTQPEEVVPVEFNGARYKKGKLELTLPAHSVVVLQLD